MTSKNKLLIIGDLNVGRPWFRERVPGLKHALESVDVKIELLDVFFSLGIPELSNRKLFERRAYFHNLSHIRSAQDHLLLNIEKNQYSHVLFTTMDICIDFLDFDFLNSLTRKGIVIGAVLGDDEFNYSSFKSAVNSFVLVVYLEKAARYYSRYTNAKIFVQNNCFSAVNCLELKDFKSKPFDLCFVGAPFKSRLRYLREVIKDPSIKLALYGPEKRWKNHQEFRKFYLVFPADKFYETISMSKFTLCSLEDMKAKKHMNTKIWEAITAGSIPISEAYPPLTYQFKLTGDLALPTFKSGSDILRILKSREDVYNLRRLRKFIIGNFDYETSYTKMIKSFSDINSTNKINNKLKIHYCAAPIRTTNRKIKAIIPLPGRNIFKVENNSFTKVSFLKSIWLLQQKK